MSLVTSCFDRITMTDAEKSRAVNAVSDFLLKSCPRRMTKEPRLAKAFRVVPAVHPVDGLKCKVLLLHTGSTAEFYIEPMLSCVGDADLMYHYNNELAIPARYPPSSQLPTDFESRVKVYEIVDSHLPGYVYLIPTYILTRNKHDNAYTIAEYVGRSNNALNHELYVNVNDQTKIHGPAYRQCEDCNHFVKQKSGMTTDTVLCIHCFAWPPQASDWPKRYRNSGWPDSATVGRIVRQGCDVVGVAHRQCKQDEWMSRHQWRLSFSRAEVVLLNSWTPVQQIVYHMLRMFVKTERLTDSADNSGADTLSNYHIKTLMLWACELKPREWWNDGSTLVRKCVQLLQFLGDWLNKSRGVHYFINNLHFLDYFDEFSIDTVSAVVRSTTEDSLAHWFIDNYIRKCAEHCPDNISLKCCDITDEIPDEVLNAILQWSDHVSGRNVMKQVFFYLYFNLSDSCLPSKLTLRINKLDNLLFVFRVLFPQMLILRQMDIVAFCYHLASFFLDPIKVNIKMQKLKYRTIDILAHHVLFVCPADERRQLPIPYFVTWSEESRKVSPLQKAVILMEFVANKRRNTRVMTAIELSKAYLQKTLSCKECDHDSTYCLTNVYLAVLYYTTGQFQTAIDHCTLVTRSQDHSQCSLHVVQGNVLPKIDDDIDSALGLVVLYQYVRELALNEHHQKEPVNVFTTEVFGHYFSIRHLLVARCCLMPKGQEILSIQAVKVCLRGEVKAIFNTILSASRLLVSDLMLCKLPNNDILSTYYDSVSGSCNRRQMIRWITQLSLQQLLRYHHLILPPTTESIGVSDITGFMALYLYRCRLYERCEQLCQQRIHELIDIDSYSIPRLSIMHYEFIQLMDDDVVSLVGLTALIDETRAKSWFREPVTVTQLTMFLYLLTKCQIEDDPEIKSDADVLSSLAVAIDWIADAQKMIPVAESVDHFMLKLAERKAAIYITEQLSGQNNICTPRQEEATFVHNILHFASDYVHYILSHGS